MSEQILIEGIFTQIYFYGVSVRRCYDRTPADMESLYILSNSNRRYTFVLGHYRRQGNDVQIWIEGDENDH